MWLMGTSAIASWSPTKFFGRLRMGRTLHCEAFFALNACSLVRCVSPDHVAFQLLCAAVQAMFESKSVHHERELDRLIPLAYEELRNIARARVAQLAPG